VNTWKIEDETDIEQEYDNQVDNELYDLQDKESYGYQRSVERIDVSNDADPYCFAGLVE
jgi:hypothetical protein